MGPVGPPLKRRRQTPLSLCEWRRIVGQAILPAAGFRARLRPGRTIPTSRLESRLQPRLAAPPCVERSCFRLPIVCLGAVLAEIMFVV
jgi:hypothetical protein